MFRSMTAYGRSTSSVPAADGCGAVLEFTAEVRSVNGKYLDLSVRLPRQLSFAEPAVRAAVTAHGIRRGRMEITVSYSRSGSGSSGLSLNRERAADYIAALRLLRDEFGLRDDISVMTAAQNRDLFEEKAADEDPAELWAALAPAVDAALDEFCAGREREGANLERDLRDKLAGLRQLTDEIDGLSAKDALNARDRIRSRIEALLADTEYRADEGRLLTECALYADRIAIDEELVRLRSHFDALEAMMGDAEAVGRKFDFQLQETGREVNTIGSKCQNASIADRVVLMKNELEKIREQIQNVE